MGCPPEVPLFREGSWVFLGLYNSFLFSVNERSMHGSTQWLSQILLQPLAGCSSGTHEPDVVSCNASRCYFSPPVDLSIWFLTSVNSVSTRHVAALRSSFSVRSVCVFQMCFVFIAEAAPSSSIRVQSFISTFSVLLMKQFSATSLPLAYPYSRCMVYNPVLFIKYLPPEKFLCHGLPMLFFFNLCFYNILNQYRDDDPGTESILSLRVTGSRSFFSCYCKALSRKNILNTTALSQATSSNPPVA